MNNRPCGRVGAVVETRDSRNDALAALGVAAALVPYAVLAWRLQWVCDDAYIAGRYAQHVAAGHGLVFNLGEPVPVEGYSDLLWVLIGAGLERWGLRSPEVIGAVSAATGLLLLLGLRRVLVQRVGVSGPAATAAVAVLSAAPPFAAWATSGLETMPATAAFFALVTLATTGATAWEGVLAALAGFALATLRPEGLFAAIAVLGGSWWSRPDARRSLRFAVAALAALAVPWLAWRLSYHGSLVPNPVRVKVALSPAVVARGLAYVALFAGTWLTPLALVRLPRLAADARWPRVAPFVAAAAGVGAFAVVVGGDYLPCGRFLHAALPLVTVALAVALDQLAPGRRMGAVAAMVLLAGLPMAEVQLMPRPLLFQLQRVVGTKSAGFRTDRWQIDKEVERSAARVAWARAIASVVPDGRQMVARGVGALGYETGLYVLDAYGIVSPEVADERAPGKLVAPGHDRLVQRGFFMGRAPDVLFAYALSRTRKHQVAESLPAQWGVFEDLGPDEVVYVAELATPTATPPEKGPVIDDLLLIRRLREGEDREVLRETFKADCRERGYRAPKLEPLDDRRRAIALEKRRGGAAIPEMLWSVGHRPEEEEDGPRH